MGDNICAVGHSPNAWTLHRLVCPRCKPVLRSQLESLVGPLHGELRSAVELVIAEDRSKAMALQLDLE